MKSAPIYRTESGTCHLCRLECTLIAQMNQDTSLNKREEVMTRCKHKDRTLLANLVSTTSRPACRNLGDEGSEAHKPQLDGQVLDGPRSKSTPRLSLTLVNDETTDQVQDIVRSRALAVSIPSRRTCKTNSRTSQSDREGQADQSTPPPRTTRTTRSSTTTGSNRWTPGEAETPSFPLDTG